MEFKCDHASEILNNLNRERTSSKDFCDFTIIAGKEKFAIHRCVVGTFSKFFKNLVTAEMKENYSKEATVQFSPVAVALVINFIYTSCIKISMDSVYEVLEASEFLDIPSKTNRMASKFRMVLYNPANALLGIIYQDLKDCCEKFFKEHLNEGNCLKIRAYAKLFQMENITQLVESFICENFGSVLQSEEFCELVVDDVRTLLEKENEQLPVNIDEDKYNSLIKWTKHDIDARSSHFSSLFTLIDLQWLSKNFLNTVVLKEKLVIDSLECTNRFATAFAERAPEVLPETTRKQLQTSSKAKEVEEILLIGGESCPRSVVKYNVISKQFSGMPNTSISRKYASALNYEGLLFLMGGQDGRTSLNTVEILDLNESTLKWKIHQTSMIEGRHYFASALLNDVIYCVGGWDNRYQRLSSVEGYDLKIGKWFGKNKMNQARCGHSLVATQGMLFAIGGVDNGNIVTNTAEMFDPNIGNWRNIPSMKTCRSGLCAVVLNQEIYAIGGWNLASVEKYNTSSQHWSDVDSMKEEVYGGSACVVNGRIYVFGGRGGNEAVEMFDPVSGIWIVETNLDQVRSCLSVVSV